MIILGLETSCDDTAAALMSDGEALSEVVSTQLEHQAWGGVVPEIASRAHLRNILPVVKEVLRKAGLSRNDVEAVAVTAGPGLVGALLVGLNFARGWTDALKIPLIGVNHLQAHAWAAEIEDEPLELPFIALIVSGGHTSLVLVEGIYRYRTLGQTLDDAAGEVLDKIGRLMGLTYPCGAEIERIALSGDPEGVKLPRGMIASGDLNFSFSGLKTAAKLFLERNTEYLKGQKARDFLASLQEAVFDVLVKKALKALETESVDTLILGGGVAANQRLRDKFAEKPGLKLRAPTPQRCTDNGVMTAYLGAKIFQSGDWRQESVSALPDLPFEMAL